MSPGMGEASRLERPPRALPCWAPAGGPVARPRQCLAEARGSSPAPPALPVPFLGDRPKLPACRLLPLLPAVLAWLTFFLRTLENFPAFGEESPRPRVDEPGISSASETLRRGWDRAIRASRLPGFREAHHTASCPFFNNLVSRYQLKHYYVGSSLKIFQFERFSDGRVCVWPVTVGSSRLDSSSNQ